ncbi:Uncharacterised protein [uncultured archaeon]|nr:Uncharacterised protein [uncultured archaeon]
MNANTKANLIFVVAGIILLIPIYLILTIIYFSVLKRMPEASVGYANNFGFTDIGLIIAFGLLIEYLFWLGYKKFLKAKIMGSL